MSVRRYHLLIDEIKRDIEECEKQMFYHLDEMQRAKHQGNKEVERHHRLEQLKWERKLREATRAFIHTEQALAKAVEEEHLHRFQEDQARREEKAGTRGNDPSFSVSKDVFITACAQ